jgi:hypothetical protein
VLEYQCLFGGFISEGDRNVLRVFADYFLHFHFDF